MHIVIEKNKIIEGLQKAYAIIPSKAGAAYLRSLWLSAEQTDEGGILSIMASDGNTEFTGKYPAVIVEKGIFGVNGKAFIELIRRLPEGEITLKNEETENEKNLTILQGRRSYKMPCMNSDWFQPMPDFPEEGSVLWLAESLHEIIERVFFCISEEENTESLNCLYFKALSNGKIDACGLNGHQFAKIQIINDSLAQLITEEGLLLQRNYVTILKTWLGTDEIKVNISERRFHVSTLSGNEILSIPRISNYIYPDYSTFLSRVENSVGSLDIDRKDFLYTLDRIIIFNTENDKCTYIRFTDNHEIEMSGQGQDIGSASEHLEAEFSGNLEKIAFTTRGLMDILSHFQSDKITFTFTGSEGPCSITGKDDHDYIVILMPMKLAENSYYDE